MTGIDARDITSTAEALRNHDLVLDFSIRSTRTRKGLLGCRPRGIDAWWNVIFTTSTY